MLFRTEIKFLEFENLWVTSKTICMKSIKQQLCSQILPKDLMNFSIVCGLFPSDLKSLSVFGLII